MSVSVARPFAYSGYTQNGAPKKGVQIAESQTEAIRILEGDPEYLTVTSCTESLSERISLSAAITAIEHQFQERGVHNARQGFYRLAVSYLKRGAHIRDAVAQYLLECPSPRFKAVLRSVLQRTGANGLSFPDAIALHGDFPHQHVEMLRIPFQEQISPLPTFERLKKMDTLDRRRAARDVLGRLSFYFSYFLSFIGVVYVTYYYLPNLEKMVKAAQGQNAVIPPAVMAMASFGEFMTSVWGVAVVVAVVLLVRMAFRSLLKYRAVRRGLESAKWMVPGIGRVLRHAQLIQDRALALSYLASMRATGIDDVRALELTSDAVQSVHFADALLRQADRVRKGTGFVDSFSSEVLYWTAEVTGLVGRAKEDFVPIAEELAADFEEESQTAAGSISAAKNFGHLLGAMGLAMLVSGTIYASGLAVQQALGKQFH